MHTTSSPPTPGRLEPWERVHQRAGTQKAGKSQGDIPENDHERHRQGSLETVAQGAVDDEQILHAYRSHIGQPQRQSLKKNRQHAC